MSIQRWDPFREALTLRDAMNRLFEDSFVRPTNLPTGTAYGLALDMEENDDGYTVRASLPGFKPEDVHVSITGDVLTIQANRDEQQEQTGKNYLVRERRTGSVSRTVTLPQRVESEKADARFENGELVLTLPKAEETKPKQIKINVQGRQELPSSESESTTETTQ